MNVRLCVAQKRHDSLDKRLWVLEVGPVPRVDRVKLCVAEQRLDYLRYVCQRGGAALGNVHKRARTAETEQCVGQDARSFLSIKGKKGRGDVCPR